METLIDGFYGLEGGMNSALSPHLIGSNQYHVGFNLTARGGQVGTRPGFRYFSGAISNYRGGIVFNHGDGTTSFVAVGGASVQMANSTGQTGSFVTAISLSSSSGPVYFCAVEAYLVIQDGLNPAKVLRAPATAGGAWVDQSSTLATKIPIGTHMAYGHGRLFVACPSGAKAPVISVNMKAAAITCTVTNAGGGYNRSGTRTYTGVGSLAVYPKISQDGQTFTTPTTFSLTVTNGIVTALSIGGTYTKPPIIKIVTNDNAGAEDNTGALGTGAEAIAELAPTEVESITVTTPGSGYTLTPRVTFDNSGTGGRGANFTVTAPNSSTLTFTKVSGGSGYRRPARVILSDLGGPSQEIFASDIAYGGSSDYLDIASSFPTTGGTVIELSEDVPFNAGEAITIDGHSSFPSIDGTWSVSNVGDRPSSKRGVKAIVMEDEGAGYRAAPTVSISSPPEGGRRARATAVLSQTITAVTVNAKRRGSGYEDETGTPPGSNIEVELIDEWNTPTRPVESPIVQLVLGEGPAIDKVRTDQVKEVIVEDGGGPFPAKTVGRIGIFNPSTGFWDWQKDKNGNDVQKVLPLPPRLRVKDGYGVAPVAVTRKGRTVWVYPNGKSHAVLKSVVTAVISEVRITDPGAGYREAPTVEIVGGKPTAEARARAVLDDTTVRDPKVFTIPSFTSTDGVGGRVRRALAGRFEDIFNFTESTFLAEGGGFSTAGFTGRINGMFFLPVANSTSGRGDLVVLGEKGAVTLAVANSRLEWKEMAFIRVILSETGAVANNAFCVAQGDVFFYSSEGLRSYRNARTGEVDGSVLPLDNELSGILSQIAQNKSRLTYCDNRLVFTVAPSGAGYKALGVLDWASSYNGPEIAKPAWDGFWFAPGENPSSASVSSLFLDVHTVGSTLLAVCSNGVFKLDLSAASDFLPAASPIRWTMETRAIDFSSPVALKRLLRGSVWVQDANGDNGLSLSWRTENRPNWTSWITNQQTTSASTRYAYRMDLPIPAGDSSADTDKEMQVANDRGQHFQFRVEGSGKLRLIKFMFYALPVVESQYGVVQSTSATIVPTGTAEPYPL